MVFFSDALSVFQLCQKQQSTETDELLNEFSQLSQILPKVVPKWIPSHCKITGNEKADELPKNGSLLQ